MIRGIFAFMAIWLAVAIFMLLSNKTKIWGLSIIAVSLIFAAIASAIVLAIITLF